MKHVMVDGNTAVVAVEGRYGLVTAVEVGQELKSSFNQFGCTRVKVDFSKTKFIDSSTIRQFTKIRRQVGEANFSVINPTGAVLQALKTAKLESWIAH